MIALSPGELVTMRGELNATLPGTAIIQSRTAAADGQGGQTWVYSGSGTVMARLSPEMLRGSEGEAAGRIMELSPWILTLPAHTAITETDRVVYDGVTYEVSEVMTRVPWEISRRVRLEEVD